MWDRLSREERIRLIREGVHQRKSAAQIAASIGGCTRNAVIGLAMRAKVDLVARITLAGDRRDASPPKRGKAIPINPVLPSKPVAPPRGFIAAELPAARRPESAEEAAKLVRPASLRLSLLELSDKVCRWPEGDTQKGGVVFCGNVTAPPSRYCRYHSSVAYIPRVDRIKRR